MLEFHRFLSAIDKVELPKYFTYPFNYVPHFLSKLAARELCGYIDNSLCCNSEVEDELKRGKMFGVLVVRKEGEVGYLAAFSGNIAHSNIYPGFVPPIYDLLNPNGFFVKGEECLDSINREVDMILQSVEYAELSSKCNELQHFITELKQNNKELLSQAKVKRDALRAEHPNDPVLLNELISESQYLKAECKRSERAKLIELQEVQSELNKLVERVAYLRQLRRGMSADLQRSIFKEYVVKNALGDSLDLLSIFADTPQGVPPAGAGECAAPKLLQFAYLNGFEPLCMAEFWWGDSPKEELRTHGAFYPSCKSKCEPILNYMMQGLNVETNPILYHGRDFWPHVVYEDEWILALDKPNGMLSMRGKVDVPSVDEWLKVEYPNCNYYVAHRLDMDTSGVLLVAKNLDVYKALQGLFAKKLVEKQYIALISGVPKDSEGIIDLPLIADIENRPFQKVDYINGKESITEYKVLNYKRGVSLVQFRPLTGRTHQIRVHAAHVDGLNAPIVGDNLYGKRGRRLMLHAESVQFTHPITNVRVTIYSPIPF